VFNPQGEQIIAPSVVSAAINGQDSFSSSGAGADCARNGKYIITWISLLPGAKLMRSAL
jgi:hypothetical protein